MRAYLATSYNEAYKVARKHKGTIVSIEAEWGDKEIKGDITLSHHGKKEIGFAPSSFYRTNQTPKLENPLFIFSHLDMDSLVGAMWVLGMLDKNNKVHIEFSKMVEISDIYGPHYIKENWKSEVYKKWITAGFIVNRNNKDVGDITKKIKDLMLVIKGIVDEDDIDNNPIFSEAYEWKTKLTKNALRFIRYNSKYVLGFVSDKFMLSNYNILSKTRPIIIQYNPYAKRISMSVINKEIAQKVFGDGGVGKFMKEKFGEEAGGKSTIGGTPRFVQIEFDEYKKIAKEIDSLSREKLSKEDIETLNLPKF